MPVGRILLKSISDSRKLAKLKTDGARLLYSWLNSHLNIIGCFSGDAAVVNGKVFTRLKKTKKTIEAYLKDQEKVGLIYRYKVDNDLFLIVPNFVEKQPHLSPTREGSLSIPLPPTRVINKCSGATQELIMSYSGTKYNSKSKDKYKVNFNFKKEEWENVTEKNVENWIKAYPNCDIMVELYKMKEWLLSNPEKRKKNYRRFITNWLSRSQEKGGTKAVASYRRQEGVKRWLQKSAEDIKSKSDSSRT